jgi:hypothetical protein
MPSWLARIRVNLLKRQAAQFLLAGLTLRPGVAPDSTPAYPGKLASDTIGAWLLMFFVI